MRLSKYKEHKFTVETPGTVESWHGCARTSKKGPVRQKRISIWESSPGQKKLKIAVEKRTSIRETSSRKGGGWKVSWTCESVWSKWVSEKVVLDRKSWKLWFKSEQVCEKLAPERGSVERWHGCVRSSQKGEGRLKSEWVIWESSPRQKKLERLYACVRVSEKAGWKLLLKGRWVSDKAKAGEYPTR